MLESRIFSGSISPDKTASQPDLQATRNPNIETPKKNKFLQKKAKGLASQRAFHIINGAERRTFILDETMRVASGLQDLEEAHKDTRGDTNKIEHQMRASWGEDFYKLEAYYKEIHTVSPAAKLVADLQYDQRVQNLITREAHKEAVKMAHAIRDNEEKKQFVDSTAVRLTSGLSDLHKVVEDSEGDRSQIEAKMKLWGEEYGLLDTVYSKLEYRIKEQKEKTIDRAHEYKPMEVTRGLFGISKRLAGAPMPEKIRILEKIGYTPEDIHEMMKVFGKSASLNAINGPLSGLAINAAVPLGAALGLAHVLPPEGVTPSLIALGLADYVAMWKMYHLQPKLIEKLGASSEVLIAAMYAITAKTVPENLEKAQALAAKAGIVSAATAELGFLSAMPSFGENAPSAIAVHLAANLVYSVLYLKYGENVIRHGGRAINSTFKKVGTIFRKTDRDSLSSS